MVKSIQLQIWDDDEDIYFTRRIEVTLQILKTE